MQVHHLRFHKQAARGRRGGGAAGLRRRGARLATWREIEPAPAMAERIEKSDAEWRAELSETEYTVLRQKGTEPAGSGEYNKLNTKKGEGHFACRGCGAPLYSAEAKFNSGCGWPAFDMCYTGAVKTVTDNSFGMQRIEIMCNRCDGHLGHVRCKASPPRRHHDLHATARFGARAGVRWRALC